MVQLVHHVRQANRVDVEHSGRVRIRAHLRRIAGNQKQVPQAQRRGAQQVGHHAEQIAIAAAVVQHRLRFRFRVLHHQRRGHRAHARLRARPVGNVDAIDTRVFQKPDRIQSLPRIAAFRRQHFDRGDKFTRGDLARPVRTLLGGNDSHVRRLQIMDADLRGIGHNDLLRARIKHAAARRRST